MTDIIVFGGTVEGRVLAELLQDEGISALVCVATEYGEGLLKPEGALRVHAGRMDEAAIAALLDAERPRTVIDATHPYALAVSDLVQAACKQYKTPYIRVNRESCSEDGYMEFDSIIGILAFLSRTDGVIFSTLGAKEALSLTTLSNYQERMWLRILPSIESLDMCLKAGYPAKHIICMQGPFSRELNIAMLQETGTSILVTKESGAAGGFPEKLAAAKALGVTAAVLKRPVQESGYSLSELIRRIKDKAI